MVVQWMLDAAARRIRSRLGRVDRRAVPPSHVASARSTSTVGPLGDALGSVRPGLGAPSVADPEPNAADLVARTLGRTEIWVRGVRIQHWSTRRGLMVLRYLLWHGGPVPRDRLMHLLWPHSSERSARNNLNVAIYGLRRTLEAGGDGPYVTFGDGTYRIAPERTVWIDARAFSRACAHADDAVRAERPSVAEQQLRSAVALYRGPLFADDTSAEWYLLDRQALAEEYAGALHQLAALRYDADDSVECIDLCRQALRVEPCREVTYRLLMRAYARQRLYHLAARAYQDCVSTLGRVLEVGPHPDTTKTFEELLDHRI